MSRFEALPIPVAISVFVTQRGGWLRLRLLYAVRNPKV